MLRAFWDEFSKAVDQTKDLKISDVISALDEDLGPHFFPPREDGTDPRLCAACGNGRLGLKLGRYGSFIGCSNYPACQYTRRLAIEFGDDSGETLKEGMRVLGQHPDTGGGDHRPPRPVRAVRAAWRERRGQEGQAAPHIADPGHGRRPDHPGPGARLAVAAAGDRLHPETQEKIEVGIGRFGPYVRMGAVYGSLDRDDDVLAIGMNRAVDLLAKKLASVRTLGPHPVGQEPVTVRKGEFGPYVQHGKTVANLPRGVAMEDVTLNEAVALLAEKGKPLKPRGASRKKARASGRSVAASKDGGRRNAQGASQ